MIQKNLKLVFSIMFLSIVIMTSVIYSQAAFAKKGDLKKIQEVQSKQNQAKDQKRNYTILYQQKDDLNPDNQIDNIAIIFENSKKRYCLKVNDSIFQMKSNIGSINNISVIDIKANDSYKEILIEYKTAKSQDYTIFWYDGKNIKELLNINSKPIFLGNGEVIVETDMGFWTKKDIYVLDESTTTGQRSLNLSPQELYDVNVSAVVKKPFKLYSFRDAKKVITITEKSEVIEIISCDTSNWFKNANQKNNKLFDWYLIKTKKGIQGWARLKDFINSVEWMKNSQ